MGRGNLIVQESGACKICYYRKGSTPIAVRLTENFLTSGAQERWGVQKKGNDQIEVFFPSDPHTRGAQGRRGVAILFYGEVGRGNSVLRENSFHFFSLTYLLSFPFHFFSFPFIYFQLFSFPFLCFHFLFVSLYFLSFPFISFHFLSSPFVSFHFLYNGMRTKVKKQNDPIEVFFPSGPHTRGAQGRRGVAILFYREVGRAKYPFISFHVLFMSVHFFQSNIIFLSARPARTRGAGAQGVAILFYGVTGRAKFASAGWGQVNGSSARQNFLTGAHLRVFFFYHVWVTYVLYKETLQ